MAFLPFASPRVRGNVGRTGAPYIASGTFTADGATDPTVQGGIIGSVRRLVDGGALPFFRCRLDAIYPFQDADCSVVFSVQSPDAAAPAYAALVTDLITPVPADARGETEIDVAVYLESDNSRVDTADYKVSMHVHWAA